MDKRLAKRTLYDVQWQALRVSLLGQWFTEEGTAANLDKLRAYVQTGDNLSKVWRALNLLNATHMGFSGAGLAGSTMDQAIVAYKTWLSDVYKALKDSGKTFDEVTEEAIREQWVQLSRPVRAKIIENLAQRLANHVKSAHRTELRWFLEIVRGMPV